MPQDKRQFNSINAPYLLRTISILILTAKFLSFYT